MAGCAFCKSETEFYDGGVPICVNCSDARASKRKPPTSEHQLLNVLREDLQSAKERARAATAAFDKWISIEAGVGFGLTSASDKLTLKLMVSRDLN